MKKKYDSYEIEIILSLGFLILFLISINFISGYSFQRARRLQASQFERDLSLAADYALAAFETEPSKLRFSRKTIEDKLQGISFITGISNIALIDTAGRVISSTFEYDTQRLGAANEARRPIHNGQGAIRGYVVLSSENKMGIELARLSRWDTIFRVAGLASALVIGSYFLWAILMPYRRIKNEALDFNLDNGDSEGARGVEYIVATFKNVIAELEEKKRQLEILYQDSERRADSLARYNEYILGSITSGVVICDSDGIVTRFNKSAQSIFQQLERDCRGKHYRQVFSSTPHLIAMLDDALEHRMIHSRREFEVKRADGDKLWLGCSSSLINDERGEGMGAALLLIDLTEIRRLQEISSYSEKMIALGETAAGLAHEVRNSFAAIIGFARLAARSNELSAQSGKLVEAIKEESVSAEALMTRFLSFAKPLNLHPSQIELQALLCSTLENIYHPMLPKIKFEKIFQSDIPPFYGDPQLLRQALSNIIINACDALPHGGEIRIRTTRVKPTGTGHLDEVAISVIDNGVGIKPDSLARIFEPFFTDKLNGTGLGLALVKKIIVLHGGRINVYSKPGKGTRFSVYLPIRPMENHPNEQAPIGGKVFADVC